MPSVFCDYSKGDKIRYMKGVALTFRKKVANGTDAMGNVTYAFQDITIDDCLIAPIIEPTNLREQQAMEQSRDQVRIHLPKTTTQDISGSDVIWDRKQFHIDSDSVVFMAENTPTRWNRYFRAEFVQNHAAEFDPSIAGAFITEDGAYYFITEDSLYYFAQEVVT